MQDTDSIEAPLIMIPGVRKCGTTTLFRTLERHSQICVPVVKEPQFFALQPSTVSTNMDWYKRLYPEMSNKVLMDGSTLCFTMPDSAEIIAKHVPDVKIIIMLRDPAKRAFSAYLHMARQIHKGGERRTFEDILDGLESRSTGVSVVEQERRMIDESARLGLINKDYYTENFHRVVYEAPFDTDFADMLIGYRYFEESHYSSFIRSYEKYFGDRLKIVFFEQLVKSPETVLLEILDFAGLEAEPDVLELLHANKGRVPKGSLAVQMLKLRHENTVFRAIANTIKKSPIEFLGRKLQESFWKEKTSFDADLRRRTSALLADEYKYWFDRYPFLDQHWVQ